MGGVEYFMLKNTLGESYFEYWNILERKDFVDVFNMEVCDRTLKFSCDLSKIKENVDVVIISGALQYLPNPIEVLKNVIKMKPQCVLITRTPFWEKKQRLTKQLSWKQESNWKERLSYPFFLMNEKLVMKLFENKYKKLIDFPMTQKMFVTRYKGSVKYRAILFTKL